MTNEALFAELYETRRKLLAASDVIEIREDEIKEARARRTEAGQRAADLSRQLEEA